MTEPIDIADPNERRLLLQRRRNRRWRASNPELNRAAMKRAAEVRKQKTQELKRLRRENAAMLTVLRSLLDESRWAELDELITEAEFNIFQGSFHNFQRHNNLRARSLGFSS